MRKSKKRVIAIITCCFILATFCVGVFADNDINPNMDRVGTILTTTPYDLGDLVVNFNNTQEVNITSGYYIVKLDIHQIVSGSVSYVNTTDVWYLLNSSSHTVNLRYNTLYDLVYNFNEIGTYYIYVYIGSDVNLYKTDHYNTDNATLSIYSLSDRSVIDSIYSNSQDVHSSLVSVINEATNVITTNDVVMMFCILIPVISFGVGILIRLRKRS